MATHHFRFLALPPELRNMIYRYTLVEGRIRIRERALPPPQPGLLQVNRQIRSEAIKIYYTENIFYWNIRDFDGRKFLKWSLSSKDRKKACHTWRFRGACKWDKVLPWLKAVYCSVADGPRKKPKDAGMVVKAAAGVQLFRLVRVMGWKQGLKWKQVEEVLKGVHTAFMALNKAWN